MSTSPSLIIEAAEVPIGDKKARTLGDCGGSCGGTFSVSPSVSDADKASCKARFNISVLKGSSGFMLRA